jgi:hypothetical protein
MIEQATAVPRRVGALNVAFIAVLVSLIGLAAAQPAQAVPDEYGIESVSASLSTLEAGRHPDMTLAIQFKEAAVPPTANTESLAIDLPPGLTANPRNFPECPFVKFNNPFINPCPDDSQVGLVEVRFEGQAEPLLEPLYNLPAPEAEVARLGFIGFFYPYYLEVDLRSQSDYGVTVRSSNMPSVKTLASVKSTTWGVPADPSHDAERRRPIEALFCPGADPAHEPCAGGERPSGLAPEPFVTNPANCGPADFRFTTTAYPLPGQEFTTSASAGEIIGCEQVPFDPSLKIEPTSHRAGAATGLEAILEIPSNPAVNTVESSPLRSAKVVLPDGMTINPSAADGLEACDAGQAAYRMPDPAHCPDASKLGTAEFISPNLKRPIQGGIFLRTPEPGHLFRFWLVSNELGVNLKLPAEVELDPATGRLTTVVEESPQLPAEKVVLRLNGGARAPLRNPISCGTLEASYELTPWSGNAPAVGVVHVAIDQGCGAGGFDPKLSAGTASPSAGSFSPFVFDVSRQDGEQNIGTIDVTLPRGLVAKLAGVPLCPEGAATGGTCPGGSRIGEVSAAVGAGSLPLWIPQAGKERTAAYLAGPYKGAPYSVVVKVPAQAGPFDLGVVTVRSGIYVDPETAQVTVRSDPLPQILQGVPIDYRNVRVEVDRHRFTINPTSCAEKGVSAAIISSLGTAAHAGDRFQAADCASLGFGPKLALRLKGGMRRGSFPALEAVLKARPGQANLRRVSVALPHSEFLEQAHIGTVCTRVQFAADACPAASIYGRAEATTPLLDQPLKGLVYLRSSSHPLPDLVVDLRGQLRVTVAGRIDSVRGGIRTTFTKIPDAAIRKFVLKMKGGAKGLLVNSRNLCIRPGAAVVQIAGQNGKVKDSHPPLRNGCAS